MNGKKSSILVWIGFFLFSGPLCAGEQNVAYEELCGLHEKLIKIENEIFDLLTFTIAEDDEQIASGSMSKLVLKDQLGEKWIYKIYLKTSIATPERAIAASRMFRFYGLEVPKIYGKVLSINGSQYKGSVIKYIENMEGLPYDYDCSFSPASIRYLLQAEVLNFLISNLDAKTGNFLVKKKNGAVDQIVGIDFDLSFMDLGFTAQNMREYWEECRIFTCFPIFKTFWEKGLQNNLRQGENITAAQLVLQNLAFISFVEQTPEYVLEHMFSGIIEKATLAKVLRRKDQLLDMFIPFYESYGVLDRKDVNEKLLLENKNDIFTLSFTALQDRIEKAAEKKRRLETYPREKQKDISAVMSPEAWGMIANAKYFYNGLIRLKGQTDNLQELRAISEYMSLLEQYKDNLASMKPIVRKAEDETKPAI